MEKGLGPLLLSHVLQCSRSSSVTYWKYGVLYLSCGVFLWVPASENNCHFSNKACINKAFIAILLLWHQKILIPSGGETQDFFAHLWNSSYLLFRHGVSGCHSHAACLGEHIWLLCCLAEEQQQGWSGAHWPPVQYGHGLCVPARCHACACGVADSQGSMWKQEHGQRVHSCCRSA